MMGIRTNMTSLALQQNRVTARNSAQTAIQRLSSGLRINSSKNDAAGRAIANKMESSIRANAQSQRGMNDGISLIQTAEGGLNSINNLLHRANRLAVQAASETLSSNDRSAINGEYMQLRDEIDRIANATEAFGKMPLAPAEPGPAPARLGNTEHITVKLDDKLKNFTSGIVPTAYIPAGATQVRIDMNSLRVDDDMQLFTLDGKHLVGTPVIGSDNSPTDYVWSSRNINDADSADKLMTEENGLLPGAAYDASVFKDATGQYSIDNPPVDFEYNGMRITYSGDRDRAFALEEGTDFNSGSIDNVTPSETFEVITIDKTTEPLMLLVVGRGIFYAKATWDEMPVEWVDPEPSSAPTSQSTTIVTSADYGNDLETMTIEATPSDHRSLGLEEVSLDTAGNAQDAISYFQSALQTIGDYRGYYGATQNRLESAVTGSENQTADLYTAQSRIMDADYALESSRLVKSQILQRAGDALLAQANQSSQNVLKLLNLTR
ncbi:flagellin [Halomonas sp. PAMB 3264]|uniref:flagellin N-terminal helical domain-containing protein n=1 Tax=Halomonas sp. PAMB 3264 TaxID=3075222 RepID=UPI002898413E|nr:flagellin [Halomonas sp. PAMB 3264]WNL41788.1 flagellin [Halomonas sp. PAMB 3264]